VVLQKNSTKRKNNEVKGMLKVKPQEDYPPEPGCYLIGNYYSPVAVVVLFNAPYKELPSDIESIPEKIRNLVRVAIETGASFAGTLQTENIGIEKIVANIASNPNIRYLILCGRDVEGHNSGDALRALIENGIDEKRTIIGSKAVTPYLFNIPLEAIEIFRNQVTLVDLLGEEDQEVVAKAVWSCYQEKPTKFRDYTLCDPGAYSREAKSFKLTMRVDHPEEIEEWELDEVVEKIKSGEIVGEKREKVVMREKFTPEKYAKIGKHLAKISEELSEVAKILMGEEAAVEAPPPREEVTPPKEEVVSEEEKAEIVYFDNQLRGYNGIFAAFRALKEDICGVGLNLPVAVNKAIKKLKRLKEELEESPLPAEEKEEIGSRIDEFLSQSEELPTDPGPCQKTVGTCKIGKGCFATGALDMLKLITEPER
jgi:tetrahydromethanopterin S-methyltransferase subunit A